MWLLEFYATQHRMQFLCSFSSVLQVFVFAPVVAMQPPDVFSQLYVLVIISRYIRIIIFTNTLTKYH